jgi:hypothetical protein
MDVAAGVAAVVIATGLWAAAIAKLVRPESIRVTLIALGAPVRHSWAAVYVVVAAEASAALLLVIAPRSPLSFAVVVALFGAFAVAGAVALRAHAPIACACFGSSDKPLGWRQLAQLPVVTAMALLVLTTADWTAQDGLALTAAVLLGIGAWWAIRAWPTWQVTRRMRVSLREAQLASNEIEMQVDSHG